MFMAADCLGCHRFGRRKSGRQSGGDATDQRAEEFFVLILVPRSNWVQVARQVPFRVYFISIIYVVHQEIQCSLTFPQKRRFKTAFSAPM
jgi:hypothetical protein